MIAQDLLRQRLLNQRIAQTTFAKPEQVVSHLGAVQAQEYPVSKWSIGLRSNGLVDHDVEKAVNDGKILRTHALRPTWHFVTAEDIRWILMLNKPRVTAAMQAHWKQLELNNAITKKSSAIIVKALQSGKQLKRTDIKALLEKQKLKTDNNRLSHMLMVAELDALICSGPREGKHFTYMLMNDRVPSTKPLTHDEAVYKLTERYFTSRGPATIYDYARWSGLTMGDIRKGVDMLPKKFMRETFNDQEYIFIPNDSTIKDKPRTTFLMPDYDEYGIGYKERSALNPHKVKALTPDGKIIFQRLIVLDGVVVGGWKKTETKNGVVAEAIPTIKLNKSQQLSVQKAVTRFHNFANNIRS